MKSTGVIKARIAQTNPESFKDAKTGEWKGVNVDLLDGLADWVKVKVDWVGFGVRSVKSAAALACCRS